MEIGLTEAVRKMASTGALPAAREGELLFCWDLARIDFGQRKLLVASNAATRLCAITRMVAADWKHIDEVALRFVEDAVGCAGLDAARYLELAGEVRLSKTHGRRALGCMNDLSRMLDRPNRHGRKAAMARDGAVQLQVHIEVRRPRWLRRPRRAFRRGFTGAERVLVAIAFAKRAPAIRIIESARVGALE